jgi:hypothetical protein
VAGQRVPGEREDGDVLRLRIRLEAARGFPAVHARQRKVHQHDVRQQVARHVHGLQTVARLRHAEAGKLEVRRVHLARILLVLDDEHERPCANRHRRRAFDGSRSVNVEPWF